MAEAAIDYSKLKLAIESGMIDYAAIQEQVEMADNKKYLSQHKSKIYQGGDGRWNTYLPDTSSKYGRRLVRKNTKNEVEKEVVEYYKQKEVEPTVGDVFYSWLNSKLEYGEILQQTYDRYEIVYNRYFLNNKKGIAGLKIKTIDEVQLEDFIRRTIHDFNLTVKAWGNLRIIIRGIFKYARRIHQTSISISQFMGDLDLSKNIFNRKLITDDEQVFTDKEVEMIRDLILGEKKRAESLTNLGILLAMKTGLRAGELATLKYTDIKDGILTVRRTEIRYKNDDRSYEYDVRESTKGRDGIRRVILPNEALDILKRIRKLNPFGEYLFTRSTGSRILGRQFTVRLKQICRTLGIKERTLHKLRKTYATTLLNANVDEKLIMSQMGHTDISTTKTFYYFDNHDIEESKRIINAALDRF